MSGAKVSVWRQPAQVWAVAFACVIAFMALRRWANRSPRSAPSFTVTVTMYAFSPGCSPITTASLSMYAFRYLAPRLIAQRGQSRCCLQKSAA